MQTNRHHRGPRISRNHTTFGLGSATLCFLLAILAGCGNTNATSATSTNASTTSTTMPKAAEQVTVPANGAWVITSTTVNPGERLTVGCNGAITVPNVSEKVKPAGEHSHKAGSNAPAQGVYAGAVVARIANGSPFYVGAFFDHTMVPATGSGALELSVNTPQNNNGTGAYVCLVTKQTFQSPAMHSVFQGTATVHIYDPGNSGFGGPFTQDLTLNATFDGSHTLIELTSFPKLRVGPISTTAGNDYITVEPIDVFGAFGPYGPSSTMNNGDIKGLPVNLKFQNSLGIAGTCTAPFVFTTGRTTSPGRHLQAAGSPLIATGHVELVGSSKFTCHALYNPTNNKDVLMSINGQVMPTPIAYGS